MMRLARFVDAHPEVGEALFEAWLSVSNADELARAVTRVEHACSDDGLSGVAERELGALVRLAQRGEHHEVRLAAREWAARHARAAVDAEALSRDELRHASVTVTADGGEITGSFGVLDAAEMAEIFAHYLDAEWRNDWDTAVAEHGEHANPRSLSRTDRQRRADALKQIFLDAGSTPPGSRAPEPVVNIHVDHTTALDLLTEANLLPERDVDPFDDPTPHLRHRLARTDTGIPLHHASILQHLLDGYVRIVVRDDDGIPIHWGRTKRLFEGAARDAVRVLSTRCTHPGCRVRVTATDTDHTVDWANGGLTDPTNGNPRCRKHNNTKNRGYTVTRDTNGHFHTHRPDGTEV